MKHIKNKYFRRRGMTFLELMVAIFVLIVGISGTLGLIHRTISSASMTTSQLKAAYLAQEGVEVVRNIRDSNWVSDAHWLRNIDVDPDPNIICTCCEVAFDHGRNTSMTRCPVEGLRQLRFLDEFYGYDPAGVPSIFSRRIETSMVDNYLRLRVIVSWDERGTTQNVTVVQHLYNWR